MKKTVVKRFLAVVSVLSLMISVFAVADIPANADAIMSSISVQWANPQKLKSIDKQKTQAVLSANINKKTAKIYISFPKEGGIRLRTDTVNGYFEPKSLKNITYYDLGYGAMLLKTDTAGVKINYLADPWSIEYLDGNEKTVHKITRRQMFFGYKDGQLRKVKLEGSLSKNEVIYGLGERYNGMNQVGSTVKLWNFDTAYHVASSSVKKVLSYANVPLMHSNKGYSLFFNSFYGAVADIGERKTDRYSLDFNGTDFDFFVYTDTPSANIEAYTNLTGKPATAPKWAFRYWAGGNSVVWTEKGDDKTADVLNDILKKYNELGTVPSAVYAEGITNKDSTYTTAKKYGVRVLTWNTPAATLTTGADLVSLRALLPEITNDFDLPAQRTLDGTALAAYWMDFSNPNAVTAYKRGGYDKYISQGLSGAMVDYGEYIDEGLSQYNGMKGDEMHNFYPNVYTKSIREVFTSNKTNDFVLFARAACAGSQRFGGLFGGDQSATFDGLRQVVYGGLNVAASGFSNWGSDIGSLSGTPSNQLYMRWLQFGAFSPFMRIHGYHRDPWNFGDLGLQTFKEYFWLRENLLDYIYSANLKANKTGVPIMQSMAVAFPEESTLADCRDQYMFGDSLLVCPIIDENTTFRSVTLPKGSWTDFWSGKTYKGGQSIGVTASLNRIPLFIRGGAVIKTDVSKDFDFRTSLNGGSYEALIAAPAKEKTETAFYTDKATYKFKSEKSDDASYSIKNTSNSKINVVIAAGTTADSVMQDGKKLTALSSKPTGIKTPGYYVDYAQRRTIIITDGSWNSLKISDSGYYLKNLALDAKYTSDSETVMKQAGYALDGDGESSWQFSISDNKDAVIDLGVSVPVNEIVMRWTAYAPDSYKLQVSNDLSSQSWTVVNGNTAVGGDEHIAVSYGKVRYLKISDVKWESQLLPALSEIEVYGTERIKDAVEETYNTDKKDTDASGINQSDTVQDETNPEESEDETPTKKRRRKVVFYEDGGISTVTVIIIVVCSAVLIGGIAAAVIIIRRRRKKTASDKS